MPQNQIQEHIDLIAKHEQEFLEQRTLPERVGDAIANFAGSIGFVFFHMMFFVVWISWNTLPMTPHYDPAPSSLLGTLVALEAILLPVLS